MCSPWCLFVFTGSLDCVLNAGYFSGGLFVVAVVSQVGPGSRGIGSNRPRSCPPKPRLFSMHRKFDVDTWTFSELIMNPFFVEQIEPHNNFIVPYSKHAVLNVVLGRNFVFGGCFDPYKILQFIRQALNLLKKEQEQLDMRNRYPIGLPQHALFNRTYTLERSVFHCSVCLHFAGAQA